MNKKIIVPLFVFLMLSMMVVPTFAAPVPYRSPTERRDVAVSYVLSEYPVLVAPTGSWVLTINNFPDYYVWENGDWTVLVRLYGVQPAEVDYNDGNGTVLHWEGVIERYDNEVVSDVNATTYTEPEPEPEPVKMSGRTPGLIFWDCKGFTNEMPAVIISVSLHDVELPEDETRYRLTVIFTTPEGETYLNIGVWYRSKWLTIFADPYRFSTGRNTVTYIAESFETGEVLWSESISYDIVLPRLYGQFYCPYPVY